VNVIRDGKQVSISQWLLVTGDILRIESGLIMPVDCYLLKRNCEIICDESALTGESEPMNKIIENENNAGHPFLLSGSKVLDGDGLAVVCCVGENSLTGILKNSLNILEEATPLQKRLTFLADQIGRVGLTGAGLAFAGCFMNLCLRCIFGNEQF